ncbi:hypothetical protein HBI70_120050 [Parastagonospora nodorum]|nr:hypothetical protein HBI10_102060 [Parastagonospora nodorum]KAH4026540.1 hypothetical protein HBI13_063550 [Parastagonospora nodorum]KAH4068146.1 hypothetical protein HBH50_123150 [Parastagonospora nodorum]KAH4085619.1 hypothetical protein HBH48_152000 [Parastagonospora nodorum]KAH4211217.1 hypothetical protein HBI95_053390 [Parastagonospora nodorum]
MPVGFRAGSAVAATTTWSWIPLLSSQGPAYAYIHPGHFAIRRCANINLDCNLPVPRATLWYLRLTSCSTNPVGTSCSTRPYYPTIALGADYNYPTTATSSHLSKSSIYILSSNLYFSLRLTSRRQRASLKKEATIPTHT